MALSDEQLSVLRVYIQIPLSEEWNDDRLNEIVTGLNLGDRSEDLEAIAAAFWRIKANDASTLVDVTEDGSSRKLGSLFKNYLDIAKTYQDRSDARAAAGVAVASTRPKTRAIVRP